MRVSPKGFTLIELAVIILILAVLAGVAIPRFVNGETQAERVMIQNMRSSLGSAAGVYAAEQGFPPSGFDDFVETAATSAIKPKTISIKNFGNGTCTADSNTISGCTFKKWDNVSYNWNNGQITVTATGPDGMQLNESSSSAKGIN